MSAHFCLILLLLWQLCAVHATGRALNTPAPSWGQRLRKAGAPARITREHIRASGGLLNALGNATSVARVARRSKFHGSLSDLEQLLAQDGDLGAPRVAPATRPFIRPKSTSKNNSLQNCVQALAHCAACTHTLKVPDRPLQAPDFFMSPSPPQIHAARAAWCLLVPAACLHQHRH